MTPAGGCGGSFKCTDLFDRNNAPLTSPAGTTINESQFFKPPPCKVVFSPRNRGSCTAKQNPMPFQLVSNRSRGRLALYSGALDASPSLGKGHSYAVAWQGQCHNNSFHQHHTPWRLPTHFLYSVYPYQGRHTLHTSKNQNNQFQINYGFCINIFLPQF